jgi:hypothetical protein
VVTDAAIRDCRIMDNLTEGVQLWDGGAPALSHCLITANGQNGIGMYASANRRSRLCQPLIENCVIVDNGGEAISGGEPIIVDSVISE